MTRMYSLFLQRTLVSLCIVAVLLVPQVAFGQNLGMDLVDGAATQGGFSEATDTTFATTIGTAIRMGLSLVGALFTVLTVYAGFLWMTARGDEGQVDKAKKTMQNSLIGLFIAIGSYSLSGFVIGAFETGSSGSAGGGSDNAQCCIICQGEGISCGFDAVEEHDNTCSGAIFSCVQPLPISGRCRDLEDDFCVDRPGRPDNCVNRKRSSDKCADYLN